MFFPRRGYNPIDPDNRADFFDSIYHSAAVVGINTSAMIEAAIIGRPVFSMLMATGQMKLGPDELQGGTFTITNPGPYGTTMTMPIINQPQVAILSTDGVKRRRANKNHILEKKSSKRKNKLGKPTLVSEHDTKRIRRLLGK